MTEAGAATVAITGATGFIGAAVARRLAGAGWRVRLLARPGSLGRLPLMAGAQPVIGELTDPSTMRRLVQGVQAVVHCAGAVRGATRADFERVNVDAVAILLDALDHAAAPRLLHLSSLAARHPELSHYAASKRAGERLLVQRLPPAQRLVVRPPAVYGPGDRELRPLLDAMARGLALVPGSRMARFSLLHVDDLSALVATLLAGDVGWGEVHEPDDGHPGGYDWRQLTAAVARVCGRSVRALPLPGPLLSLLGSANEARARLFGPLPMLTRGKARELRWPDWVAAGNGSLAGCGWRPGIDLERGLRDTFGI
ncbi:MAG: NAD-dependent epimerase/dehydratase family protein [Immundisolibacter sp.]